MKKVVKYIKKKDIFFILLLTIITSIPLFINKSLPIMDDVLFHVDRISLLKEELSLGNIFNKMYHGYLYGLGYGTGLFYPDLFFYVPALLNYLGINLITTYKIFIVLINFASLFSVYYVVKKMFKNRDSAIVSTIIYSFASYRLLDIYIRNATGEALAFIFVPIIIYGIYLIIYDDYKKIYILILGMSGLIYSHLVTSYMCLIVLFIVCLIFIKKLFKEKKRMLYLIIATIITLLITSYYWLPMLEQLIDRNFYIYHNPILGEVYERAVPFYQTIFEINYNNKIWIPKGIGIVFVWITILKIKNKKIFKTSFDNILFWLGIIFLFMSTNIFPWKYCNKIFGVIQFPWRLYLFPTIFLTVIGGNLFVKKYFKTINKIKVLLMIILLINVCYIINDRSDKELATYGDLSKSHFQIGLGDYFPQEIHSRNILSVLNINRFNQDYRITKYADYALINYVKLDDNEDYIEVPYMYYLGYVAEYNNKQLEVIKTYNGLLGVNVHNIDKAKIKVYYKHTKLTNLSFCMTIVGIIILSIYIFVYKGGKYDFIRRKNFKTKNFRRSKSRSNISN